MSEWGGHQVAPAGALAVALCRAIVAEFGDCLYHEVDPMTWDKVVHRAIQVVEVADAEETRSERRRR